MRRLYHRHKAKINYLLVGIWNTLFGYLCFVALYYLLTPRIHYLAALVISNILSISNAYVGYKLFVFRTTGNYFQEYLRFYAVYGLVLLVNLITLPLIVTIFKVNPVVGQALVVFFTIFVSYLGHKNFTFS